MRYFLIAGEASGDLHASNLMKEIKKVDHKAQFCFLGGDLMEAVGGKMVINYRNMAYMGFVNVLMNLNKVLRNIKVCKEAIVDFNPDVVILIDYPGFNLPIAKFVKRKLNIPVYYYIPPKIWAWKEYRIKDIKKYIDKVFTIFPFETGFYKKHNYKVEYVGNPSVDSVNNRPLQQQSFEAFCTKNTILPKPVIALLAGSRKQEISKCLPRMIAAATKFDDYQIVVAGAPGIDEDYYQRFIKNKKVKVVFGQTYELLTHADVAVVNSGTATLETAIINTPQVVVYHVMLGRLAYWAKNIILKVKYISLVNLIAEKEVVVELIAHKFTVENLVNEINKIINYKRSDNQMIADYEAIRLELGPAGAAQRLARLIYNYTKDWKK